MIRSVVTGVTLALVCFELLLRQFYFVPWEIDPEFGVVVTPGATAVYRREGSGRSRWTEHGVRRAALLEPGRRPILALGDSFTEAYMLDDDEVFPARAESQLAAAGHPIPVLNAGKSDMSAADYVANAERNLRVFDPRWVVVQLREDDLEEDAWSAVKTHFQSSSGGGLDVVVPPSVPQTRLRRTLFRVRQASAVVNFTTIRLLEFEHGLGDEPPLFRAGDIERPTPAAAPRQFPIAAELDALAGAYRGRVTMLFFAAFDPLHPGAATAGEERFDAWCRTGGRSCVNVRAAYGRFAEGHASPYGFSNTLFNVGHMNADGHAAVGKLLAQELERLIADGLL